MRLGFQSWTWADISEQGTIHLTLFLLGASPSSGIYLQYCSLYVTMCYLFRVSFKPDPVPQCIHLCQLVPYVIDGKDAPGRTVHLCTLAPLQWHCLKLNSCCRVTQTRTRHGHRKLLSIQRKGCPISPQDMYQVWCKCLVKKCSIRHLLDWIHTCVSSKAPNKTYNKRQASLKNPTVHTSIKINKENI